MSAKKRGEERLGWEKGERRTNERERKKKMFLSGVLRGLSKKIQRNDWVEEVRSISSSIRARSLSFCRFERKGGIDAADNSLPVFRRI